MDLAVQRITKEQVGPVAAASAEAFMSDPAMCFVLPAARRRRQWLHWYFREIVDFARARGEAYTTPEAVGAALWIPPPGQAALYRGIWRAPGLLATGFCLWPGEFWRAQILGTYIIELDRAGYRAPHYYLWMLAVRPDRQGNGIGGSLLEPVLTVADRQGTHCSLVTTLERNVVFYERRGFKVRGQGRCPLGGPAMWAMRRDPLPGRELHGNRWSSDDKRS